VVATSCKEKTATSAGDFSYLGSGIKESNYNSYEENSKEEEEEEPLVERDTLEQKTIDKIIEEEKINNILNTHNNNHSKDKEAFEWYKAFNRSIIQLKYEQAFN